VAIVLLVLLLPLLDLYGLIKLGQVIGSLPVLALVIVAAVVGMALAKAQGLRVIDQWRASVSVGAIPEEGLLSGVLILAGGVLLVLPGLLSDVLGLLCLVPPTRRWMARRIQARFQRAVRSGRVRVITTTSSAPAWPRAEGRQDVIEGEFERQPPEQPKLPS